ncbi:hypothetical protein [Bacillus sp. FJAT-27916]|uniref:hypothetical protein n=1 Tax=Bacillus sp. FJAT-27916 TaxID=1679169 RepID=UPI000ACDEBE7|nr:hypothetical protein [Bacillus sp. FJAT-27916]
MNFIKIIFSLIPVPFLFHYYEYNYCHLGEHDAVYLFPVFLLFIIVVGVTSRNIKLSLFFGVNFIMTGISLLLGYFFIVDDGSWFKPFGRDFAIIFISIVYLLGQLLIRGTIRGIVTVISTTKQNE